MRCGYASEAPRPQAWRWSWRSGGAMLRGRRCAAWPPRAWSRDGLMHRLFPRPLQLPRGLLLSRRRPPSAAYQHGCRTAQRHCFHQHSRDEIEPSDATRLRHPSWLYFQQPRGRCCVAAHCWHQALCCLPTADASPKSVHKGSLARRRFLCFNRRTPTWIGSGALP